MRKIALALPILILLSGCGTVSNLISPTVSSQSADVAVNTFDALEVAATGYLQLPACATGAPVTCRNQTAAASIKKAVLTGRTARKQVELAMAAANGGAIPVLSMNTLQATIATLQTLYAEYNIQH